MARRERGLAAADHQDRGEVEVPQSLGVRVWRGPDDEADICVWTGGWADVELVKDGRLVSRCPRFADVDGACAAVVGVVEELLD